MTDATGLSAGEIEALTLKALRVAAAEVGVPAAEARLMRLGSNAVFDLGDVVARVTPPGAEMEQAWHSVAAARWLEASDVPAVLALDVEQPRVVDDLAVTFWRSLGENPPYGTTTELAELLLRLHALDPPADLQLPVLGPFEWVDKLNRRLDRVRLPADDVAFLRARTEELREAYGQLEFDGPAVVLHGDANVGNVLCDRQGVARFIDLDGLRIGPREWDLLQTAMFWDRFGWHTDVEYDEFVETYGYDITRWSGYLVLAEVRELLMVAWLAGKADESEEQRLETAKRVLALRMNGSRKDWDPI